MGIGILKPGLKAAPLGVITAMGLCAAVLPGCSVKESADAAAEPQDASVELAELQVTKAKQANSGLLNLNEVLPADTKSTLAAQSRPTETEPNNFKPIFKGSITSRLEAIGEGPYKIGMPTNGYASKYIKEAFDYFDKDTTFSEVENNNSEVCDFVKVSLFSKNIDLSEFYWPYPEENIVPLDRVNNHTYRLTDGSGLFAHFTYAHSYRVNRQFDGSRLDKTFSAPALFLCDLGPLAVWEDYGINYTTLNENRKKYNGLCLSQYSGRDDAPAPLYPVETPGSTIGFFWHKDSLYIVSVSLFNYFFWTGRSNIVSPKMIKVGKVQYKNEANYASPALDDLKQVCWYGQHQEKND